MPVATNEVTIGRQFEVAEIVDVTMPDAGGTTPLFYITGGPIYLQELTGIVTTIIASTPATVTVSLQINPTFGATPGTPVDLCEAAPAPLDIDDYRVDTQFSITGLDTDPMVPTIIGIVEAPSFLTNRMIVTTGTIQLISIGATITGAITWTIVYRPLGFGISVVAA